MKHTEDLKAYEGYLFRKELSEGTIDIYVREASVLLSYLNGRPVTKERMIAYKRHLLGAGRKVTTTNLYIVAVNSYLKYAGYKDCTIRTERIPRKRCLENVITMEEYRRILAYARESGREKYYFILKALAFTGIRISELAFLTVETLSAGKFTIENKGMTREVYLPAKLEQSLRGYCRRKNIRTGTIFTGNTGKPISRAAVYQMLIRLADMAGVKKEKAHPHSFRHLFALTYMKQYADLSELSDILGHASLETTRIYTMTTAEEKRSRMDGLDF